MPLLFYVVFYRGFSVKEIFLRKNFRSMLPEDFGKSQSKQFVVSCRE